MNETGAGANRTRKSGGNRVKEVAASPLARERELRPEIGRRLAEARRAANLRQSDAADRIGVTQSRITRLEAGSARLLYLEAVELAELYGVPVLSFDPRQLSAGDHVPRRRRRVNATTSQSGSERAP